MFKLLTTGIAVLLLTLTSCKTTSTIENKSSLSAIDFGDIKNSDGSLIKYDKLKVSIYKSEDAIAPIQEEVYPFQNNIKKETALY